MPRSNRSARGKKSSIRVDMSNVSKAFEPNQEYAVRVVECTLEEGQKAPYFNLKLQGLEGGEFENSTMYHRASTGETSLWRLRPLLEALGFDIPAGPLDLDAADFVGREMMVSTYLDRYDGGSSVKPDEFWAIDGEASDSADENEEFDLDELDDDDIEALAEALGVKGRTIASKKKALAKLDEDDLAEAYKGLGEEGDEEGEGDEEEFDLDELDDDQIEALADAMGVKGRTIAAKKKALAKLDEEEVAQAFADLDEEEEEEEEEEPKAKGKKGAKREAVDEDAIQDMNEDELEAVVEQYELDVDLSDYKTLRKMKNAVIDAMEEGGHFD